MGIGKKIKKHIPLVQPLFGPARRQELLDKINEHGTFLPKSLLHEDLDRGFLDFVKKELRVVSEGKVVPVIDILITTQNWAQFTQTWNFNDLDKNVSPPIITTVRNPEVKYGTLPSLQYTIPNRKQFFYAMVPNWENGVKGFDVYTIPQPVPVDIKYSIKIICNRMRELNAFNKVVIEKFSSRQAYTQIKGHYIPIIMDNVSDESVTELEKRKYYIQTYDFTMMGFLMDENEFQVSPGVSRTFTLTETNERLPKVKKNKRTNDTSSNFDLIFDFPFGDTSFTQEFKYSSNLRLVGLDNIDSYTFTINGLFFGSNVLNQPDSKVMINSDDVLLINIIKTDNTSPSKIQISVELV